MVINAMAFQALQLPALWRRIGIITSRKSPRLAALPGPSGLHALFGEAERLTRIRGAELLGRKSAQARNIETPGVLPL